MEEEVVEEEEEVVEEVEEVVEVVAVQMVMSMLILTMAK